MLYGWPNFSKYITELNITILGGCDGQDLPGNRDSGWTVRPSDILRRMQGLPACHRLASVLSLVFPDRYVVVAEWERLFAIGLLGASMVWAAKPQATSLHDDLGLWPHQPDTALSPVRTYFYGDFSEGRHLCKHICACAIHVCRRATRWPSLTALQLLQTPSFPDSHLLDEL